MVHLSPPPPPPVRGVHRFFGYAKLGAIHIGGPCTCHNHDHTAVQNNQGAHAAWRHFYTKKSTKKKKPHHVYVQQIYTKCVQQMHKNKTSRYDLSKNTYRSTRRASSFHPLHSNRRHTEGKRCRSKIQPQQQSSPKPSAKSKVAACFCPAHSLFSTSHAFFIITNNPKTLQRVLSTTRICQQKNDNTKHTMKKSVTVTNLPTIIILLLAHTALCETRVATLAVSCSVYLPYYHCDHFYHCCYHC